MRPSRQLDLSIAVLYPLVRIAHFREIEHIQIREISGEATEFLVNLILERSKKVQVHRSGDSGEIVRIADQIADIAQVSVRKE